MLDYIKLIVLAVITLLAAMAANFAHDIAYLASAIIVVLSAGGLFIYTLRHTNDPPAPVKTGYMDGVVRAGVIATVLWGITGLRSGSTSLLSWLIQYSISICLGQHSGGYARCIHLR